MIAPEIYKQLEAHKIDNKEVDRQYLLLTSDANYIQLDRAAVKNDGILSISETLINSYANFFEEHKNDISVQKFVPASGAATRMFKDLIKLSVNGDMTPSLTKLFNSIEKLAFFKLLPHKSTNRELANYILKELNFQNTPKGLIPFHLYKEGSRTPFEEHWLEGIKYAESNGKVRIHYTVSEEHYSSFKSIYNSNAQSFEKKYDTHLDIDYSYQDRSTDTIAIDKESNIVFNNDGSVLLRPGGHGSLIENLNELDADLVFVKNIDNVTHESRLAPTILYKKALAGLLLELKDKVFEQLHKIENGTSEIKELEKVAQSLMISEPNNYPELNETNKTEYWKTKFNRPIRICGMVKNEGEPGGGPFWVKEKDSTSLQIVESAQIDRSNNEQEDILQSSTHFNPVDIVCYLKDFKGNSFNLLKYLDESTAFITSKSVNGKDITVLERPGLWNGAMANWNTLFVEVPIETFNPVKTINNLLKPAHQAI